MAVGIAYHVYLGAGSLAVSAGGLGEAIVPPVVADEVIEPPDLDVGLAALYSK